MIVEMRIYTLQAGKMTVWLDYYEKHGLALQQRLLGKLIGFFTSEIGPLNQVTHIWAYESLAEREQKRSAMYAHPEWHAYLKDAPSAILTQETRILTPTKFSPLR
jgi:hypothetical protein